MTYWGNFTAKPRHSNAVFWPFGCIYQPNSPCLTLSAARTIPCNLLRTLMDETSQINWIIHARAFKVAWYTMQTLEVKGATTSSTWFWTDTRDVSRLLKTILLCYSLNFNVGTSLLQIKKKHAMLWIVFIVIQWFCYRRNFQYFFPTLWDHVMLQARREWPRELNRSYLSSWFLLSCN